MPESPGVLLPGDLAPGLPIRPYGGVDISIAVSSICVRNNNNNNNTIWGGSVLTGEEPLTGTGSAAHRGTDWRQRALLAVSRCSCAADGRTAGGGLQALGRHRSRAGY